MILSNVELFAALDEGRLIIRPEPKPRLPMVGQAHSPYDTHSVDLSLANEITVPRKGQITYDLTKPGMAIAQLIVEEVKGFPIENPSQFQGQQNPPG